MEAAQRLVLVVLAALQALQAQALHAQAVVAVVLTLAVQVQAVQAAAAQVEIQAAVQELTEQATLVAVAVVQELGQLQQVPADRV